MTSPGTFWDGAHSQLDTLHVFPDPGNDENGSRHNFSLGACSGCHARETLTSFTHIDNRTPFGRTQEARLSEFLLGEKANPSFDNTVTGLPHLVDDPSVIARSGVIDPGEPQHRRSFRDLEFRQQVLEGFATQSCLFIPQLDAEVVKKALIDKDPLPDDIFENVEPIEKWQLPTLSLERFGDVPVAQVH